MTSKKVPELTELITQNDPDPAQVVSSLRYQVSHGTLIHCDTIRTLIDKTSLGWEQLLEVRAALIDGWAIQSKNLHYLESAHWKRALLYVERKLEIEHVHVPYSCKMSGRYE